MLGQLPLGTLLSSLGLQLVQVRREGGVIHIEVQPVIRAQGGCDAARHSCAGAHRNISGDAVDLSAQGNHGQ